MAIADPTPAEVAFSSKGAKTIVVSPGRPDYPVMAKDAFNVTHGDWIALVDAVFPAAKTTEGVLLALSYCRARKLDPFKRPVHIVPIWDSKQQREVEGVWPGIGELRTTAARTGEWAGNDEAVFGPEETRTFKGTTGKGQYQKDVEKTVTFPLWCSLTQYRLVQGVRVPFPGPKVFWLETYSTLGNSDVPNEMWATRPCGQLEKCAEAASLRRAFPEEVGSEYIHDESGRRSVIDVSPAPSPAGTKTERLAQRLAAPPAPATIDVSPQQQAEYEPAAENQGEDPAPSLFGTTTAPASLSQAQLTEIQALAEKTGVDIGDLEEWAGGPLSALQDVSAAKIEADVVTEIRKRAKGGKK